ncbi:MAG: AMP-binding protein [Methanobacteriaceae archaeon]
MTSLLKEFVNRVNFDSYEDFKENFNFNIPTGFNFAYDVVDKYAEIDPDKIALVWCNDTGEEHTFTFADMKKYSDKAANFFKSCGIVKGDAVMLTLKNRYEFWFSMMGLHKIGAIAIPATHMLKVKDMTYRFENASVKMIVSVDDEELINDFAEAEKEIDFDIIKAYVDTSNNTDNNTNVNRESAENNWYNFTEELGNASANWERPTGDLATTNQDILLIYFSSGTTGLPKMVPHNHEYPVAHVITAKYWHNVVENGLHHTSADTGWGKAVWGNLYGQWICGTGVFIYDYDRFDALSLMERIDKYNVNTFCAPPTIYRFLIKEDLSSYDLSNLQYVTTAGESLNDEVFNKFNDLFGLKIREGFGQTETILYIANFVWMEPKPGSMGKPSPLFNVDLLDANGKKVYIGDEGEIAINIDEGIPPGLFREYYRNPEKTKESWNNSYYHSGDTAWVDEEGYYWFVGRNDDIIKSSGYRIGPFEVESAILSHPSVLECAVTAFPDKTRGQIVKASIVLANGYNPSDDLVKEIQNHVKHITAPYKYPRKVEFIDELPKTISSKIMRAEIRNRDTQK